MASLFFLLLCIPTLTIAHVPRLPLLWRRASRNVPPEGYYNPNLSNGSMLTVGLYG
jgi:hypothetical protein